MSDWNRCPVVANIFPVSLITYMSGAVLFIVCVCVCYFIPEISLEVGIMV